MKYLNLQFHLFFLLLLSQITFSNRDALLIKNNEPTFSHSFANHGNIDSCLILDDQLLKYYQFANLASRAIYNNDFEAASILYDSAFVYKENPFFFHLKNYILVNFKSKLFSKNEFAIELLFSKKQITAKQLFQDLPKAVFDKNNLALIHGFESKAKKEIPFAIALKKIYQSDQEARPYDQVNMKDPEIKKQVYARRDSTNKANFLKFEKLYQRYGFPTEEKVGIYYDEKSKWSDKIYVLLLHFISNKDEFYRNSIIEIMLKELKLGHIYPSDYASLIGRIYSNPKHRSPCNNFMENTISLVRGIAYKPFVFYSDSLMNEVNTNRISIGIDSFHISQKQVVCQRFGDKKFEDSNFIKMVPKAAAIQLPYGFVNQSFKELNMEMSSYEIDTNKINLECNCQKKIY